VFDKILIANRGEIACRIIRTARHMGVATVAVYSDADRDALHVRLADEAIAIGGAASSESYLVAQRIVDAALATGAQGIHPGYGFLAENAAFAALCENNNIAFIGPTPDAIRQMGSKSEAKRIMIDAGVPVVPGYHGDAQDNDSFAAAAAEVGLPLLIKASAGGGGKGMRIVRHTSELTDALDSARREAQSSFGDSRLLLERYLTRPRHVEVQIFFDGAGKGIHLFERDCSVQRRYQKVIEESPAPGLAADTANAMYKAAIAAGAAVGYRGAGTVEFIVDESGEFFFMEMNTRLQVEHPVTELVTGVDLVEWQLRVAAGEPLPKAQNELSINGSAVEARLYAEDPANGFLPATGTLETLRFAEHGEGLRIDAGVREGDVISIHYDPMIAKVIAWGADRAQAVSRLRTCIRDTRIAGLTTNAGFLTRLLGQDDFARGAVDTTFLDSVGAHLADDPVVEPAALVMASVALSLGRQARAKASLGPRPEPANRWSDNPSLDSPSSDNPSPDNPWDDTTFWQLNLPAVESLRLDDGSAVHDVRIEHHVDTLDVHLGDRMYAVRAQLEESTLHISVDGHRRQLAVLLTGSQVQLLTDNGPLIVHIDDVLNASAEEDAGTGLLIAPMPGRVVNCHVSVGDKVTQGQPLMVLEAMKMEHTISAGVPGTVTEVRYAQGDLVDDGAELIVIDPTE
jgi:3-methylcrotonyl-CoA carboxylase alpha subunit